MGRGESWAKGGWSQHEVLNRSGNGTVCLKNVNNYLNTNIYSYLETSGGKSSNLYLNVVHFLTPVLIRHLWQLKTVVFLHWCLIHTVLLWISFKNCRRKVKLTK
jgi:hypothetical protein